MVLTLIHLFKNLQQEKILNKQPAITPVFLNRRQGLYLQYQFSFL